MLPCLSVLVVEDDESIRELLQDVLRAEGFEVFAAANGAEALERTLTIPRPCVLLVDIHMPVVDGIGFLRALRARDASAKDRAVLVSADPSVGEAASLIGVRAFFSKPFNLEAMVETVKRLASEPLGDPAAKA